LPALVSGKVVTVGYRTDTHNFLFKQRISGKFKENSKLLGISRKTVKSSSGIWGDINNDGFLGIYKGRFSSNDGDLVYFYQPGTVIYADTTLCYGDSLLIAGNWTTEPGEYYGSIGCDSTMVVNLSFYDELNTDVILMGITLTAVATGVSYQWINCADSSIVEGAVNQSFTPEESGDYAVIVSNGPCFAVSDCYTVILTETGNISTDAVSVYPNPSDGFFTVNAGRYSGRISLKVTDVTGCVVYQSDIAGEKTRIDMSNYPPGVYILTISDAKTTVIKKIIRE